MAKSESTREWVKQVGGEPVTWKGFAQTGLVIGSLVSGISCSVWSEDKAHEALQTAEIRVKADKEDLRELVEEFRLLRGWLERQMRLGKMEIRFGDEERVIGQAQEQEQNVFVTDWLQSDAKKNFMAIERERQMRDYGPCIVSRGYVDGVHEFTGGSEFQGNDLQRQGGGGVGAAGGDPDVPECDRSKPCVTAGQDF